MIYWQIDGSVSLYAIRVSKNQHHRHYLLMLGQKRTDESLSLSLSLPRFSLFNIFSLADDMMFLNPAPNKLNRIFIPQDQLLFVL